MTPPAGAATPAAPAPRGPTQTGPAAPPGAAADALIYNFSFGSNLCAATLTTRSAAGAFRASSSARAVLPGWHLAFDLIGAPPTEPLMASIVPCAAAGGGCGGGGGGGGRACRLPAGAAAATTSAAAAATAAAAIASAAAAAATAAATPPPPPRPGDHAVHGVLYAFTPAAYARLVLSEGGALAYTQLPVWVHPTAPPHRPVWATVFVTLPHRRAGAWPGGATLRPSARYRSLVLRGVAEAGLPPAYGAAVAASTAAAPVESVGVRVVAAFFFVSYFWCYRRQVNGANRAYRAVAVPAYVARERARRWASGGRGTGRGPVVLAAAIGYAAAAACTAVMVGAMAPYAIVGVAMVAWADGGRGVASKARAGANPNNSMGAI